MTTTNLAFIKAYRQDAPQPSGPIEPPALLADPRQAAFATISDVVRGSLDSTHVATEARLFGDDIKPTVSGVARSADRAHRRTDKRPLSTFVGHGQAASRVDAAVPAEFFRPGTTVASFEWPAICRALVQQCGEQLDQVTSRLRVQADQGRSLIGVLGLFAGCGATTTTLCLGARSAGNAKRTIVVDGNFQQPGMASSLGAMPTAGWDEVLKHAASLSDAVVFASDDRLALLPLGAKPAKDPFSLATGLQAAVTAGVLRHAYDLVLVDLGAFFDGVSQPVLLELVRNLGVDAVVAVTAPGGADPRDLAAMSEKLTTAGCELLGTIENRVAKPKAA